MSEPRAPESPLEVSRYIGHVLRQKRSLIDLMHSAGLEARAKRAEAVRAESRAFLRAEGAMDLRKHKARVDAEVCRLQDAADIAEEVLKHLRMRIEQCSDEIEGSRTVAATLRAEFSVLGMSDEGS